MYYFFIMFSGEHVPVASVMVLLTMTNVLLNINAYSDSINHFNSLCAKKIMSDHEYKFMPGDYN